MANNDVVRNNTLLAEHHVEDAEEAIKDGNTPVAECSVEDLGELLDNIKNTLPRQEQAKMTVEPKIAAVIRDQELAFQLGFAKAAAAHDLSPQETAKLYDFAMRKVACGISKTEGPSHGIQLYHKNMKIGGEAPVLPAARHPDYPGRGPTPVERVLNVADSTIDQAIAPHAEALQSAVSRIWDGVEKAQAASAPVGTVDTDVPRAGTRPESIDFAREMEKQQSKPPLSRELPYPNLPKTPPKHVPAAAQWAGDMLGGAASDTVKGLGKALNRFKTNANAQMTASAMDRQQTNVR